MLPYIFLSQLHVQVCVSKDFITNHPLKNNLTRFVFMFSI